MFPRSRGGDEAPGRERGSLRSSCPMPWPACGRRGC